MRAVGCHRLGGDARMAEVVEDNAIGRGEAILLVGQVAGNDRIERNPSDGADEQRDVAGPE